MAVYSVVVAKGAKKNFFDGIHNEIWGFTTERKLLPKDQRPPSKGDFIVFGYALHQSSNVAKGGFPRVDTLEQYLYHYKPYAELLTISQVIDVAFTPDHSKVLRDNGEEIWVHQNSTPIAHQYPYRIKLNVLKTFSECDFINENLSSDVVEAFRLSSADVGSLRFASDENKVFKSNSGELTSRIESTEVKATHRSLSVEAYKSLKHKKKSIDEQVVFRKEGKLVQDYCNYLRLNQSSFELLRTQITLPNGVNLYTDLSVGKRLIEAKSDVSRNSIRTAIGQLYDYEFLLDGHYDKAVLLPEKPEDSLFNLLLSLGFTVIYQVGETFFEVRG